MTLLCGILAVRSTDMRAVSRCVKGLYNLRSSHRAVSNCEGVFLENSRLFSSATTRQNYYQRDIASYGINNCNKFHCYRHFAFLSIANKSLPAHVFPSLEKYQQFHSPSTKTDPGDEKSAGGTVIANVEPVSMKDKMKRAVRDYGATIVVFHVTLALSHYALTFMAISSGLDLPFYLIKMGISEELVQTKVMTGASNGIVAYAVYKIFAPVRIAITLSVAPILVRYLRRKGILKAPKAS